MALAAPAFGARDVVPASCAADGFDAPLAREALRFDAPDVRARDVAPADVNAIGFDARFEPAFLDVGRFPAVRGALSSEKRLSRLVAMLAPRNP